MVARQTALVTGALGGIGWELARAFAATAFAALALSLPVTAAPDAPSRLAQLHPCEGGSEIGALCGTYQVWENRAAKSGRKISLEIIVLPALSSHPKPDPVFFLAGGPGQAATDFA